MPVHIGCVLNVHTGRGVGVCEEEGGGEGQCDTPKPTPAHCTPTTRTTQNTQGGIVSSAHIGLSLGPRGSPKKPLDLAHFQFENRSRTICSRFLQSRALPDETAEIQQS